MKKYNPLYWIGYALVWLIGGILLGIEDGVDTVQARYQRKKETKPTL